MGIRAKQTTNIIPPYVKRALIMKSETTIGFFCSNLLENNDSDNSTASRALAELSQEEEASEAHIEINQLLN